MSEQLSIKNEAFNNVSVALDQANEQIEKWNGKELEEKIVALEEAKEREKQELSTEIEKQKEMVEELKNQQGRFVEEIEKRKKEEEEIHQSIQEKDKQNEEIHEKQRIAREINERRKELAAMPKGFFTVCLYATVNSTYKYYEYEGYAENGEEAYKMAVAKLKKDFGAHLWDYDNILDAEIIQRLLGDEIYSL